MNFSSSSRQQQQQKQSLSNLTGTMKENSPPNLDRSAISVSRDVASPTSLSDHENGMSSPTLSPQRDVSDYVKSGKEMSCDYDSTVSSLYSLLEASSWGKSAARCRTHPQEVRTWVVRRDKETKHVRWRLLPIHAAVIFQSPTSVVEALLEKYPTGITCVDDQGMLPLHLAFRHKKTDDELLHLLLVHHPKGVIARDNRGRTPLELGREGLFSPRLVRLYANTCVTAASQAQTPEKSEAKNTSIETNRSNKLAEDYEKMVGINKSNYEAQIARLCKHYDERIAALAHTHKLEVEGMQKQAKLESETLVKNHHEEIKAIHDVATSVNRQDNSHGLAVQIQELKSELGRFSGNVRVNKFFSRDIKEQMRAISLEQTKLQTLIARQQEELEAAQAMRAQLLRTLLQQEDEDSPHLSTSGKEIQDVLTAIQQRIDRTRAMITATGEKSATSGTLQGNTDKYQEYVQANRIEDEEISAITENSNF